MPISNLKRMHYSSSSMNLSRTTKNVWFFFKVCPKEERVGLLLNKDSQLVSGDKEKAKIKITKDESIPDLAAVRGISELKWITS